MYKVMKYQTTFIFLNAKGEKGKNLNLAKLYEVIMSK